MIPIIFFNLFNIGDCVEFPSYTGGSARVGVVEKIEVHITGEKRFCIYKVRATSGYLFIKSEDELKRCNVSHVADITLDLEEGG